MKWLRIHQSKVAISIAIVILCPSLFAAPSGRLRGGNQTADAQNNALTLRQEVKRYHETIEVLILNRELSDQWRFESLEWAVKIAPKLLALDVEEAAALKAEVDHLIRTKLEVQNIDDFVREFHFFNLHQVYQNLDGRGYLYDILAEKESTLLKTGLNSVDREIFREYLQKRGFDLERIREMSIFPIQKYAPTLELFSGFLSVDLVPIQRTGFRDGMAYGPPGSHQVERGIFTTTEFKNSLNWGLVKAKNMGLSASRKENSSVLKLESAQDALVFDIPNGELKRKVVQANYALASMPDAYKSRLSPFARLLISKPYLGLMSYFGAAMFRATIFMDAGIGNGKEIVIADRSIVGRMIPLASSGQPIDLDALEDIHARSRQLSREFVSRVNSFLTGGRYQKAIDWVSDNAKAFDVRSPLILAPLIQNMEPANRLRFLEQLIIEAPKHKYIVPFLDSRMILNEHLLKDQTYQENLRHWILVGAKPVGAEDYLHGQSEAGFFTQLLVDMYRQNGSAKISSQAQVIELFKEIGLSEPRVSRKPAPRCASFFSH